MDGDVIDQVNQYFNNHLITLMENYTPIYMSSVACHIFNLENIKREIYMESGKRPNMRNHIFFIAPPGFMKTYSMELFLMGKTSIFGNSSLPIAFENSMCLPSGQRVQMASGERKPIEKVNIGDEVIAFDYKTMEIKNAKVVRTHQMTSQSLLKLTLQDGRMVTLTPNHPVFTHKGWAETQELKLNQLIAVPKKYSISSKLGNPDLSSIIGYMLADGNFRQLTFACADEHILKDFTSKIEKLGFKVKQTAHNPPIEYQVVDRDHGIPNRLKLILRKMGLDDLCVREKKHIPEEMFTWSNDSIREVLRAVFSGDGHIREDGHSATLVLPNLSKRLLQEIQNLLLRFEILSRLKYDSYNGIWKLFMTSRRDVNLFIEKIGFSYPIDVPVRLSKGKQLGENPYGTNQDDIAWMKVVRIEPQSGEMVYNLTTELGTFIAEDIIVRNTEAGYVGTTRLIDGELTVVYGAAFEHRNSVLGIDEFSSLTHTMRLDHSKNLDNYLLTSLDNGFVLKRLAPGPIRYDTQLTLWASTQPVRFDISSGLARRFIFIYFIPTTKERLTLKMARRNGRNVRPDYNSLDRIGKSLDNRMANIREIEKLTFDDEILSLLDKLNVAHYEEKLYERLALGIYCFSHRLDKHVHVNLDDVSRQAIENVNEWRSDVKAGGKEQQLVSILREHGSMTIDDLIKTSNIFGVPFAEASEMVSALKRQKRITLWEDKGTEYVCLHGNYTKS